MIFRRKITLIISLIFFQLFYLLAHYSGQYLNLFFLLTSLAALIVCYNVYTSARKQLSQIPGTVYGNSSESTEASSCR